MCIIHLDAFRFYLFLFLNVMMKIQPVPSFTDVTAKLVHSARFSPQSSSRISCEINFLSLVYGTVKW
uniref:Putative secreted protein n=1 Tax=Anopheles marajoara TaxID=58244 RepID=A0A2M4CGV5_9DIPT